jgi:NitT/TauT family transport system permease protein
VLVGLGLVPVVVVIAAWFALTWGATPESRLVSPVILPSPAEVASSLPSLWFERALMRSIVYSTLRVLAGFLGAVAIALPLGLAMGAFAPVRGVFAPVATVGSYLPIAALVPLTLSWFGTGETQKVFFLGLASFVVLLPLVVAAVDDVDDVYLKTAYTLGAGRAQAVLKVLVPIALPSIYDAMRLTLGVGWTYIILAEIVDAERGLGYLIMTSQRRGPREHIYLVLVVIVLLAFLSDKGLAALGRLLFPHREAQR